MSETIVQKKIGRLIHEELSSIMVHGRQYVPGAMLSISVVRPTGDLSLAKVYVTVFPDSQLEGAIEVLNENSWELRKLLSARIRNKMRKMPELRFYPDDSFREAERIEGILSTLEISAADEEE